MTRLLHATRYALPVLFLGYAGFVNVSIFSDGIGGPLGDDVLSGGMTEALGGLYSKAQPHRDLAVSTLGAARYLALSEGRDGVTVGEDGWLFSDEEMVPATDAQISAALDRIAEVDDRLASLGTDLVVVPVPAKIDIYRDRGDADAGEAMEAQYRAFLDGLSRADVPAVETRPALLSAAQDGTAYLTSDTHWTPQGAQSVAARVAASGLVPEGDTEFERVPARPHEFIGDLVSFVTSDTFAPSLGLGPERVTPYVAEKAGAASDGIFAEGSGSIDTVLVGTSYSANENWSFVPALKLALDRDVLNLAEEGQGPVAPMRTFLSDPALKEAPPRTVIWEYPVRYLGADPQPAPDDATASMEAAHG